MKIIASNKKAYHEYFIIEKFEAGIELRSSEVKSLQEGRINLKDSFCKIENRQLILYSVHISPYQNSSFFNHDPERPRRLLMHRKEILRIHQRIKEEGLALIPLAFYYNEKGWIKVEIGLAKGKKLYDKRESIAEKDFERRVQKAVKYQEL